MNLIVDVGNSRTKCTIFDGCEPVAHSSTRKLTAGMVGRLLQRHNINKSIVSLSGYINQSVVDYLIAYANAFILDFTTELPIKNCYASPQTLGYDRIAVAAGANFLYPGMNALVVDCGTAITYELVTSAGEYLGGAISPGISLRFRALNDHTSKLPLIKPSRSYKLIGNTTETCIAAGVQNGVVAEVENYITQTRSSYGSLVVVLTGGDAKYLVGKLKNTIFVAPNLLAIGLNRILEYSSGKAI